MKTALLILVAVAVWVPFLFIVIRDIRDWRRANRLQRDRQRLLDLEYAYRDLDLTEPRGRKRLGIPNEEET